MANATLTNNVVASDIVVITSDLPKMSKKDQIAFNAASDAVQAAYADYVALEGDASKALSFVEFCEINEVPTTSAASASAPATTTNSTSQENNNMKTMTSTVTPTSKSQTTAQASKASTVNTKKETTKTMNTTTTKPVTAPAELTKAEPAPAPRVSTVTKLATENAELRSALARMEELMNKLATQVAPAVTQDGLVEDKVAPAIVAVNNAAPKSKAAKEEPTLAVYVKEEPTLAVYVKSGRINKTNFATWLQSQYTDTKLVDGPDFESVLVAYMKAETGHDFVFTSAGKLADKTAKAVYEIPAWILDAAKNVRPNWSSISVWYALSKILRVKDAKQILSPEFKAQLEANRAARQQAPVTTPVGTLLKLVSQTKEASPKTDPNNPFA